MNCKNCQTELEEGVTLCPNCGTENAEPAAPAEPAVPEGPAEPEKTGLGAGKIALLVVLAVAAIAVVVALLLGGGKTTPAGPTEPTGTTAPTTPVGTVPADGNPDDVTCKGSYTVTDEQLSAAVSDVVAIVGDRQLNNEQLQVYYWMQVIDFLNEYYSYASMFGLNLGQPLDTQLSIDGTKTWQQYFLEGALSNWHHYQAMCMEAEETGYVLEQQYADYLQALPANLEQTAVSMGYENANAMIQADMGPGANLENYLAYMNDYYLGYMFYGATMESIQPTDAEIEAYFDQHAAEYLENGLEKKDEFLVDVRHILIMPTSATGASTFTEEEWAAAEVKANEVLNQWLSGTADEESFAALAKECSEDPGSVSNGGLYQNVYVGQMVPEFNDWCFDETRQYGDYGIVKTTYGYHIMYFVRSAPSSTPTWYVTAQEDLMVEKGDAFLEQVLQKYPAEFHYSAMVLGYADPVAEG